MRIGFQFKIRQDRLDEYKELHKHVWPEMLDALRESGWHNYTLFSRQDVFDSIVDRTNMSQK